MTIYVCDLGEWKAFPSPTTKSETISKTTNIATGNVKPKCFMKINSLKNQSINQNNHMLNPWGKKDKSAQPMRLGEGEKECWENWPNVKKKVS